MLLTLERQTSSSTEFINEKEVCVVVKQSIFTLTITSPHRIDGTIDCELVYDMDDLKPVGYVSQNPLSFKVQQITSNTVNVECKLAVLSSQHEDLLFRVHVKLLLGDSVIGSIYSHPIKSTSKADSHRKTKLNKNCFETKPKKISKIKKDSKKLTSALILPQERSLEIEIIKANRDLIQKLNDNLNRQNEKTKTLNGSISELIWKLSQYDYNQHVQMICEVLNLFTPEQLEVLQEIASIFQSACPIQNTQEQPYVPYQEMNAYWNPNFEESFM
ncbi:hypothetical protein EHI8A_068060 [Entamoeba histolytica HM-1:IMSS-B]|uniref:CudA family protein n=6 Tax=Entamoeba histolytica TaxID=5759 RepID=C4LZA5_ENTH1|nr:hypothetical protein EHI_000540 [Entamoeba histolytica HM-1:IMSS]EMD43938.1 Hypothetical protein EHI5A_099410 [Entamoeba histolytica KU27]EMH72087.1 hypothetical protein EHI8A_068060 [Entamoeba histolytica HM-1:IMSS-B]EMS13042.1 hypothetical protein KM1_124350 [Entamoeba histolytica HM-3:IMSS]ENY62223.1 hypothetical protein EHI7A_065480 [Entamoeba histolytica HM-1:IMSS-A]GAT94186.1 hypothetical protein CL6EHI_000540 [Entamoeba histolytica]|eukprot:XP_653185.1 hypothetical protein EHI_000540 [Entamoeba histolytica HM-1:IMSS]